MITSFLICCHEILMDMLGNFLHRKSKQRLEVCDVEPVLNYFYLGFALECPNPLHEIFFQVEY